MRRVGGRARQPLSLSLARTRTLLLLESSPQSTLIASSSNLQKRLKMSRLKGQLLSAQRTSDLYDTSEDEAELQGLSGSSAEVSPCVSPAPPKIVDFVPKKIQFVQADAQGDCNLRPEGGSSNAPAIVVSDPDATEAILGGKSEGSSGTLKMATQRPKSPRPSPRKEEANESFWDKFGTLGRKKKIKEVQEVQTEGKICHRLTWRTYLKELIGILIEWINDELANDRIIVKHIEEDLYDGMVFHKLIEKLTNNTLDVQEVTQSEEGQKQKLRIVLNAANHILGLSRYGPHKWLPENCIINVVIVQKRDGQLNHRIVAEELTGTYDDLGLRCERDAFDTLFDHAPDKLAVVKRSLVTFVNKQLNKINLETFDEKLHNVSQSFELMMDAGLAKPKARPEDIVNADLKSTLRVLYNLFTRYKNTN
ncbi:Beta-parvin [Penaeus vannamei]|uniref:Beta-parvin n=1 Tax=Penaeus vannamei TaxID=6689 RepID=A0A3R7PB35_PENVA|nr:Beta-parvin [Penaeus vannamei]